MASHAGRGRGREGRGDPLRLLGYLKANDKVAYVLGIMVMVHLSNQYDRQVSSELLYRYCSEHSYSHDTRPRTASVSSIKHQVRDVDLRDEVNMWQSPKFCE